MSSSFTYLDRETSWLRFGSRVLQEAEDPAVPLLERLFFCGVFSSNLDEYFRVRVASLRTLLRLGKADEAKLGILTASVLAAAVGGALVLRLPRQEERADG